MVIQGIIHTKKGAQMEFKDYYQTLGLTKTASQDDIKKAYRKLARKYHPDVSKEANAEVHMKEVNEAYAVLSDIEKRAAYDRVGEGYREGQEFRAPPDWDAGFEFSGSENADVSDFFENLFGRMRHGQTRQHGHAPLRGEDQHAKIIIDLFDSYQGGVRQLILGVPQMDSSGQVFMQDRKLDVRIPKGIREGQHIRLAGQGKPGVRGGEAGDLFLEVHFAPNNKYHVDGRDVIEKIPVSPWEAALGGDIEVTTPTGKVQVTIPASSQSGRKLRLKGRGIPGNPAGDLYLVLEVVLPEAKTEHQREIYRNMAHEMAFNPRESKS